MTKTFTSGWETVTDGDTGSHSIPSGYNLIAEEVRWRGITQTETRDIQETANSTSGTQQVGTNELIDTLTNAPDVPNDAYDVSFRAGVSGQTSSPETSFRLGLSGGGGDIRRFTGSGFFDLMGGDETTVWRGFMDDFGEATSARVTCEVDANYKRDFVRDSQNLSVSIDGALVDGPGALDDGQTSAWYSTDAFDVGTNSFFHHIAGSDIVEFQFRYSYTDARAVPTPVSSEPTTASIANETVVAPATPVSSEPLAALRDFSEAGPGWLALLETDTGDETRVGANELTSVDIQEEHTAAWGGTVELPPIIDLDAYRGGSMQLRYDGALKLRVPELTERKQAGDGTLTISGIGPAAEFREFPVDRVFNDILVTDAMGVLLATDAGLSASQIDIHPAPDDPVTDEVVQSATNRDEFANILLERSRNESGQFVSEQGGTAPDWQATDPLSWDGETIRTTQTLHFNEAEGFDSAASATTTTVAGASGGEIVEFGATETTTTTYTVQFGHVIPEGEFGISIRGKSESISQTGTTSIRVRADDHELVSFPVDDFLTGQGFEWKHIGTDFTPGTDEFSLRIDVISAGDRRLDMDCVAVYDGRYTYHFDNDTNAADALSGPELFPDTAPLHFQSAPVGIALDSATATATFDVPGESARVGIEGTAGGTSSHESVSGTTGSHTAQFAATTPGIRPLVSLSRASDGRVTTPTSGNRPQRLTSVTTTITGNAIPIIDYREFEATNVFDALQTLCNDYNYVWVVEHGRERGHLSIELFRRGDPALRRELPQSAVVTEASESAAVGNYANIVTVVGAEKSEGNDRYMWTEKASEEIEAFGVERAPPIENDDLETTNDCRSVARAELAKRLDEDERGGSLETTPAIVDVGYPYHVPQWDEYPDAPGWGQGPWGQFPWGSPQAYATLESASLSESPGDSSTSLDFSIQSGLLAALSGGL